MNQTARKYSHKAMDAEFSASFGINVPEPFAASAASAAFARIDAIELTLSRFNDSSDVALIRSLSPGQVATVAPETMDVILAAAKVCAATNGAFDPTLGPVMDRLRAQGASWENLPRETIADALARSGMQRLVLDPSHLRLTVTPDRLGRPTPLELDFGGIGKGYALDECRKLLQSEQFEIESCLLDAGTSTILAWGAPWRLGVGGVWKSRTKLDTVVELSDGALSGSGTEIRGEHVVDPRRGKAARQWKQTWSMAPTAAIADALSTAALSLTRKELLQACQTLNARVLLARPHPLLRDPLLWLP